MLLRFRVSNFRSIRDEQELSLVATELNEGTAVDVPTKPSGNARVLPVVGIYGPNASGKSNLLAALTHLTHLVRRLQPDRGDAESIDWQPHLLDEASRTEPTRYEVDFLVDGVRYSYGLSFTNHAIREEWLRTYPKGRRQVWFERDPSRPERLRFPDNHLGATESALAELARPDRPFMALANEVRHAKLAPVGEWFSRLVIVPRHGPVPYSRLAERLVSLFSGEDGDRLTELLRRADPGIEGSEIVETMRLRARADAVPVSEVQLRHHGRSGAAALPMRLESAGTQSWLAILRLVLPALRRGGVVIVDELEESLHPELVAETIRMFYDRHLNRNGAQLLFSSHNVSLLSSAFGRPLLDRDQIWLTEKSNDGATELFPLADLKPRKGENLERGYLSGRYGAVPGLSPGELARALWADEGEDE